MLQAKLRSSLLDRFYEIRDYNRIIKHGAINGSLLKQIWAKLKTGYMRLYQLSPPKAQNLFFVIVISVPLRNTQMFHGETSTHRGEEVVNIRC